MTMSNDPTTCLHCDREREGHSYLVLYGEWDPDRAGFARAPGTKPVCRACWQERYARTVGAHYEIHERADIARVWDMLAASDGRLVADLYGLFVGSRPFVRVVNGDPRGVKVTWRPDHETETLRPTTERIDFDRDRFDEVLAAERHHPRGATVILRPVEETPFRDVRERGDDSHQLTEFHGGDTVDG